MENFSFYRPTRIIFGRGSEDKVGKETKKYGKKYCFIMAREVLKELVYTIR